MVRGERRGRVGGCVGGGGPALGGPTLPAAVEDDRAGAAHGAEHPPEPGGPLGPQAVVKDQFGRIGDAVAAGGLRKGGGRRHHETVGLVIVGEVGLQVEEAGAGDVSGVVLRPARLCANRSFAAVQEHGGLEDADVGIRQALGEPFGGYQVLWMRICHDQLRALPPSGVPVGGTQYPRPAGRSQPVSAEHDARGSPCARERPVGHDRFDCAERLRVPCGGTGVTNCQGRSQHVG